MGAMCACAEGQDPLAGLDSGIKCNIQGDKIAREKYIGPLFELTKAETNPETKNLVCKATGPYKEFHVSTVAQQQKFGEGEQRPVLKDGKIEFGPNCKLEVGMYLVKQIFNEDENVAIRLRLEIQTKKPGVNKVAAVQVLSTIGPSTHELYSEVPIYGNTTVVDVGFQAEQVNTNTRQSTPGDSKVSMIYKDSSGSESFTITKVTVYTCRAPEITGNSASLFTTMKVVTNFELMQIPEDDGGISSKQASIEEPKIQAGTVDAEGQADWFLYGNSNEQVVIDVPFSIEPSMLTFLSKNFASSKLLMTISIKGSNAGVVFQINGKTQKPGGKEVTDVDHNGLEIELEMPQDLVTFQNMLQISSQGGTKYLGIKYFQLSVF